MIGFIITVIQWVIVILGFIFLYIVFHLTILKVIRKKYPFPIPAFATRLIDNPIRRKFIQNPKVIADRMHLTPGMFVIEIGPGKGSYTKAVAEAVLPDGKVYAIDIQEEIINYLKRRVERENIPNIIPRVDDAYNLSFNAESVDCIFAIGCLPEIPDPVQVLRECKRVLRPTGLVSLCELFPDPDYPWRRTEVQWAEEAGLELREQFGNWFAYQLNFSKKKMDKSS